MYISTNHFCYLFTMLFVGHEFNADGGFV